MFLLSHSNCYSWPIIFLSRDVINKLTCIASLVKIIVTKFLQIQSFFYFTSLFLAYRCYSKRFLFLYSKIVNLHNEVYVLCTRVRTHALTTGTVLHYITYCKYCITLTGTVNSCTFQYSVYCIFQYSFQVL